jgi:uncharacterized protein YrzB (UPF0473 family)
VVCKIRGNRHFSLDARQKKRYTIGNENRATRFARRARRNKKSQPFAGKQERNMAEENKALTPEEEYEPDLLTLEDEDGNEVTFEVIDALDHNGVHYLAVVEYVENEEEINEDAQLVILSVGTDEEGEYLDVVEDDDTLIEVSKLFEQRLSENFDIES